MNWKTIPIRGRKQTFKHPVKIISLTPLGEEAIRRRRHIGKIKSIAGDLAKSRTPSDEIKHVVSLVEEAFILTFSEFYYSGKTERYERLVEGLEERLRQALDKEIADRGSVTHDVYVIVERLPTFPLLEDARNTREMEHFLTRNHRYILAKKDGVTRAALHDNNVRWRDRIMQMEFSGGESFQDLQDLTDPWRIVEQERRQRATPGLPFPQPLRGRDGFDLDKDWELDIDELQNRWQAIHHP